MHRNLLAVFFSCLFLIFTVVPSIIVVIDDSIDVSFVYDMSEEEEEKGNENSKEFETLTVDLGMDLMTFSTVECLMNLKYTFKSYQKPHLNLISPPPEHAD